MREPILHCVGRVEGLDGWLTEHGDGRRFAFLIVLVFCFACLCAAFTYCMYYMDRSLFFVVLFLVFTVSVPDSHTIPYQ